jgi:ankyrin repeat protein
MLAVNKNHFKIIKLLVDNGANINEQSKKGFTPLLLACDGLNMDAIDYFLTFSMTR